MPAADSVPVDAPDDEHRRRGRAFAGRVRHLAFTCLVALVALASAAPPALAQVDVTLETFGAGNAFRPGEWVGARLRLVSQLDEAIDAIVEFEVQNADGDTVAASRRVPLVPGQPITRWFYPQLPPAGSAQDAAQQLYTVRVFESSDGERGREVASAPVSPQAALVAPMPISMRETLIGVVGSGRMGLDQFANGALWTLPNPSQNEKPVFAWNIAPEDLPDRWEGLAPHQALVWSDASPRAVRGDQGRALREWIRRGGHLVIVLPENATAWALGVPDAHELSSLLPPAAPERLQEVPVELVLPVLSKTSGVRRENARTSVHVFGEDALADGWQPAFGFPTRLGASGDPDPRPDSLDGRLYGVRRAFGFGHVTLVGLDVDAIARLQLQAEGLPQADVFWNPILARRGAVPSGRQLTDLRDTASRSGHLNGGTPTDVPLGSGETFQRFVQLGGSAVVGYIGSFLLFVIFWVLAGPGSFVVLRWRGRERMAWLVFVAFSLLFTGIGWGFAALGRASLRNQAPVSHLSVIDYVARPGNRLLEEPYEQRIHAWFTAYLANYGPVRLTIENADDRSRDLLGWWVRPDAIASEGFPDADRYVVPDTASADYTVPSRATAAQFQARWLGTLDGAWGAAPFEIKEPIEIETEGFTRPNATLRGKLVNTLGATLHDTMIIEVTPVRGDVPRWIGGQLPVAAPTSPIPMFARMYSVATWETGSTIDLGLNFAAGGRPAWSGGRDDLGLERVLQERFVDEVTRSAGALTLAQSLPSAVSSPERQLALLSLYSVLTPPEWLTDVQALGVPKNPASVRFRRHAARELDLGPWLARPCLIVMGTLRDAETPLPLLIDGERPESRGTVFVRWIHPLDMPVERASRPLRPETPRPVRPNAED